MFGFRASRSDDVEALFALWREAVDASHGFVSVEHRRMIDPFVRTRYLPTAPLTLAVDADDHPLGFIGMVENQIDSLFVDPEMQGRGIGRALVAHGGRGHDRLLVEVNEQNASGLGFYLHLGFRPIGRSETDELGLPYPLIHLERIGRG